MTANDVYALRTIKAIEDRLGYAVPYDLRYGGITLLRHDVTLAKKKTRFRPLGILDYAHFTVKGLAEAIDNDSVIEYYIEMLEDPRSPDNVWKDKEKEKSLKLAYAVQNGFEDPQEALEYYLRGGKPSVQVRDTEDDEHIGCFSYPCCDLSPIGCTVLHGSNAEPIGHRD